MLTGRAHRKKNMSDQNKEFAGSPCPRDPDNFWIDDKTGERVNTETGERTQPANSGPYAVIYDLGKEENIEECYFENFDTPQEAARIFRDTFPAESGVKNARLVKIMGPIDNYTNNDLVLAKMWTDDKAISVEFSVTQWLRDAEYQDILDLARCKWSNNYSINEISDFYRNNLVESLYNYIIKNNLAKNIYEYIENHPDRGTEKQINFEASVDSKQAIEWIKINRPIIYVILEEEGLHA